jgi:hypothetical protein
MSLRRTPVQARVAHRTVRPLRAGNARPEIAARVARALIDGGELHARHGQQLIERERYLPLDVAAHHQPKTLDVDLGGNERPVPAHEEAVVGREQRAVEHFERRFEQRRASALQDHLPLLRKAGGERALVGAARQRQPDRALGQCGRVSEGQRRSTGGRKKVPPGRQMA